MEVCPCSCCGVFTERGICNSSIFAACPFFRYSCGWRVQPFLASVPQLFLRCGAVGCSYKETDRLTSCKSVIVLTTIQMSYVWGLGWILHARWPCCADLPITCVLLVPILLGYYCPFLSAFRSLSSTLTIWGLRRLPWFWSGWRPLSLRVCSYGRFYHWVGLDEVLHSALEPFPLF
jgi:hypothetical protein